MEMSNKPSNQFRYFYLNLTKNLTVKSDLHIFNKL